MLACLPQLCACNEFLFYCPFNRERAPCGHTVSAQGPFWNHIRWGLKSDSEVTQSCPSLCYPMDHGLPAPPSMGFPRQEHWSGVPLPSLLRVGRYLLLLRSAHLLWFPGNRDTGSILLYISLGRPPAIVPCSRVFNKGLWLMAAKLHCCLPDWDLEEGAG